MKKLILALLLGQMAMGTDIYREQFIINGKVNSDVFKVGNCNARAKRPGSGIMSGKTIEQRCLKIGTVVYQNQLDQFQSEVQQTLLNNKRDILMAVDSLSDDLAQSDLINQIEERISQKYENKITELIKRIEEIEKR